MKAPPHIIPEKTKNKKAMFGESDSDSDGGFGKKKVDKKPVQNTMLTTNNLV